MYVPCTIIMMFIIFFTQTQNRKKIYNKKYLLIYIIDITKVEYSQLKFESI